MLEKLALLTIRSSPINVNHYNYLDVIYRDMCLLDADHEERPYYAIIEEKY